MDEYLFGGRFSEEFRFRLNERQLPECHFEPVATPLRDLVCGFSRYKKFQDEFLARADQLGIAEANSIMVFYFMVYSPKGLPVAKNPEMQFIGNFWFEGFE